MTTIYEVAAHAGVSAATVSRVLNNRSTVQPELVTRVQRSVKELGYRPNSVARNLRRRRTSVWAVIIPDIANPFFTSMVRAVEDVAQAAGYSVVLCNSDENIAKEQQYISVAIDDQVAGVIISPAAETSEIRPLLEAGTPVVAVDRLARQAKIDTVLADGKDGGDKATTHLIEGGYRRIACITGPRDVSTAIERLAGYRRAQRRAGIKVDRALVRYSDYRQEGGANAMRALLALDSPPDAVFVANNLMTVGAMSCLVEEGRRIPEDIGLVGFDDIPWAGLVRPSLTTVSQPIYEMGATAARLLVRRINDPSRSAESLTLRTTLNIRESSAFSRCS